uniref:ATP-binding cassette sub-family B member 9 n=1 Tax=Panagrolaimus davidi TaxID=227884 RepID=A0A914P3D7_9BILA
MNKIILVLSATVIFVYFDLFISAAALGFYHSTLYFDFGLIKHYFLFKDGYYSFYKSPIDFILFSILRSVLLIIGICLFLKRGTPKWNLLFTGIELGIISFTFIKILAFSEYSEQLYFYGFWVSLLWNILASFMLCPIWFGIFRSEKLQIHTASLWSQADQDGDTRRLLVEEDTVVGVENGHGPTVTSVPSEEKKEEDIEAERASTIKHMLNLLSYCKHHGRWFGTGFIFLVMFSVARVFQPYYTAKVVSNIIYGKEKSEFLHSIIIMCSLCLVSSITGGLRGGCFSYATALVANKMRSDLFKSLIYQEIGFFDERKTGEIMSRLTADCQTMSSTVSTNINVFARNMIMVIGSMIFMCTISWRLTFAVFVTAPLMGFITKVYGNYYDKLSESTQSKMAEANSIAEQALGTIRTVRSFACEHKEVNRFEEKLLATLKVNGQKSWAYLGYATLNEFGNNATLIAILFYGGHLVLTGKMTGDALFSFLLYQTQIAENVYAIGWVFTGIMEAVGASRKVFEYMEREPKIKNDGEFVPHFVYGKINFNNISFSYPTRPQTTVLDNVSFEVQLGRTVALVGPSGAGKSSIISLLEHFYEPSNGQILLDDNPINQIDHKLFHQKVSLVSQEPVLHDGTVRYNILYGCEEWATEEDMIEAAKLANIHDFIMESEKGYDTECGEKGVQMSGGQKQRIAIARALVRKPAVLILDEATSALDSESEHVIQEALANLPLKKLIQLL